MNDPMEGGLGLGRSMTRSSNVSSASRSVPPLGFALDPADRAERLHNREQSWLEFNRRVLALAEDQSLPLLDRVRFLSIFSSNLDEFFQVRVALLRAEADSGVDVRSADGMTPAEQLAAIRARTLELIAAEQDVFTKDIRPALGEVGIILTDWEDLDDADRRGLSEVFDERIFPVLTPLAVDPDHPFPYVSDLSFNLAVLLRDPTTFELCFARLKVPPLLDRFLALPDGKRFIPIEHVIAAHLDRLFPGMEIESHGLFRVTRDADLDIEEADTENLLLAVESGLHRPQPWADSMVCYASYANSFVLRSDGTLGKCTVALSHPNNRVGRLLPDGTVEIQASKMTPWVRGLFSGGEEELRCPMIGLADEHAGYAST